MLEILAMKITFSILAMPTETTEVAHKRTKRKEDSVDRNRVAVFLQRECVGRHKTGWQRPTCMNWTTYYEQTDSSLSLTIQFKEICGQGVEWLTNVVVNRSKSSALQ